MKFAKNIVVFLLVFTITAVSIAAVCAALDTQEQNNNLSEEETRIDLEHETVIIEEPLQEEQNNNSKKKNIFADTSASSYTPRLTAPDKTNKYYYSDKNIFYKYGWGMPNCTCYAFGRAYEILGKEPNLCMYSAYLWYEYNKEHNYYKYGKTPKLGAIACWTYSSGTSGHVAVVEKISKDTITFSNSAYGGDVFYTSTAPINDPSNGNDYWIFQGYIYIGDYASEADSDNTENEGDVYRITSDNGVNLRSGAGTSYKVIGAIAYGQTATVTKIKKADGYNWGYTSYNGKTGWFVIDFAELVYKKTEDDIQNDDIILNYIIGDVDGDNELTITDATMIQRILAKLIIPTEYMLKVADYDGNSEIDINDVTKIQRHLVHLA